MKYLIFLALFLVSIVSGFSQNAFNGFTQDTLTNTDTNTYTLTTPLRDHGVMEYHVAIDSLSGTPAGTISYEYSLNRNAREWYQVATDTIADAGETSAQHKVTNFAGVRARVRIMSSGTQSLEANVTVSFKKY